MKRVNCYNDNVIMKYSGSAMKPDKYRLKLCHKLCKMSNQMSLHLWAPCDAVGVCVSVWGGREELFGMPFMWPATESPENASHHCFQMEVFVTNHSCYLRSCPSSCNLYETIGWYLASELSYKCYSLYCLLIIVIYLKCLLFLQVFAVCLYNWGQFFIKATD